MLRDAKPSTRAGRAAAVTVFFQFLELRHKAEIHQMTGHIVACPVDEVNRPRGSQDAALRIPLQTAGFRYQRFRPFGRDGDHLYAWIEGGPYRGSRPHVPAELSRYGRAGRLAAGRERRAGAGRRGAGRRALLPDAG